MGERLRVLVVDDCGDARESWALLVGLWGFEARTAGDGPGGLAAAQEFRPDAVLLDIGLAGYSGFELARRLRSAPGLAGALLIALTGHQYPPEVWQELGADFDHYLLKPADPEEVRRLLLTRAAELPPDPSPFRPPGAPRPVKQTGPGAAAPSPV